MPDALVTHLEQRRDFVLEQARSIAAALPAAAPEQRDSAVRTLDEHLAVAERIERRLALVRPPKVEVVSEPLTYERETPHSWFRDLLLPDVTYGAVERQERHTQEMRVIAKERETRALRSLRSGEFEYRIEPNQTVGGSNFTPPLWWNEKFATAPRPHRVLADLIRACGARFPLPSGISSVNMPIIQAPGTVVQQQNPTSGVAARGVTDAKASSIVATFVGEADVALQLLEQSPAGAHLDWAFGLDLLADYDYKLEQALLSGLGSAFNQLLGVTNVPNVVSVTYTDASPAGPEMWPYFGNAFAQVSDGRGLIPQCWLWRGARWAWLAGQEDNSNRPLGLPSPYFLGNTDDTPDPLTGIYGIPLFADNAISATQGTGANQDSAICLRPSDLILLEGANPSLERVDIYLEPGSGNLSARLQIHNSVAAINNRYPSGIAVVGGSGFVVQSGE